MSVFPLLYFPAASAASIDPFWTDTILLMPLDSASGYSCRKGRTTTVSPYTTLNIQTIDGFECSNTWGYVSSNSLFNLGNSNFTIECYARFSNFNTRSVVFQLSDDAGGSDPYLRFFSFTNNSFVLDFTQSEEGYNVVGSDPSFSFATNTWYHIAATREGNSWKLWVNGLLQNTITDTRIIIPSYTLLIKVLHGGRPSQGVPVFPFDGYVHSLRVTRACRYTANFTPPSVPLPIS
jgi:hypothetical protein